MIEQINFHEATPLQVLYITLILLGIMYTALTLYFEHRADKQKKEWQEKLNRTQSLKKN